MKKLNVYFVILQSTMPTENNVNWKKDINTSRTILQREYPLEYDETADFINKQFERHKEMFFERKMTYFTAFAINTRYSMPIASTNKQIFWKLNLMLPICQITNSPKNISSYWNMAYLFVRQRSISIEYKFAMTTKDFAETSDYMNIFHHAPSTIILPKNKQVMDTT